MNERNLSGVNGGKLRSRQILADRTGSGAAGVGYVKSMAERRFSPG